MRRTYRYRNTDHLIRGLVMQGAGVEPERVHPGWVSPKNQGVHTMLRQQVGQALQRDGNGSNLYDADDLLQEELGKQVMFLRVGKAIQNRRHLFQRPPVEVLGTTRTPLLQWLNRRVVDVTRKMRRDDEKEADFQEKAEGIYPPDTTPTFWEFLQDVMANEGSLGIELRRALRDLDVGRSFINRRVYGHGLEVAFEGHEALEFRDLTGELGLTSSATISSALRRVVEPRVHRLLTVQRPDLMARVEDAYHMIIGV